MLRRLALVWFAAAAATALLAACRCAPPPPAAVTSRAPAAPALSWMAARHAAKTARDAGDFAGYRGALEALYARSQSPWVLLDVARADVLLHDDARALDRLGTLARSGFAYALDQDEKLAPLRSTPAYASLRARFAANDTPVSNARVEVTLPAEDLVTEDIAFDPVARVYFVSSVVERKILAVGADGRARDFFGPRPGVDSILDLALASGRLWVSMATTPLMDGYDPHAPVANALLAIDPSSGALLERVDLRAGPGEHMLSDLTVAADGAVYVSDAMGGAVYVLPPGGHELALLIGGDELVSPQTPVATADGKHLLVPDYVRGIASIDLHTRSIAWLEHSDDVALAGIDGLYAAGTSLVAIQNGMQPPRVARFTLDSTRTRIVKADVLERATTGLGEPTHGVVWNGALHFLADAGWNRHGDDGKLLPSAPPASPAIWTLPL